MVRHEAGTLLERRLAIAEHASGDIVVGTGRGVDRLQPDSGRITHYAAEDGVPRGEIHGITRDRTGHIWLATSNGVARLATTDAPASTPPATVVTAIRLGGVPLGVAADGVQRVTGVRVGPGVPAVEIDYVSPGARAADGLAYQQRTIGGGEWVTSRARTVTFATPSPGVHRFEVRAILASGIAGEPAVVEFTVLAPVWARAWFVSLVAAVLAGAVWLLHRARVERLLAIQRVRSQIAADLHDGVGARLSRIAVLSEVVRQQAEASLPAALPALAAIGENAREVIDDMSDAVWFVDARSGTLEDVLGRLRALATELFETQAVRWTIEVPSEAPRTTLTPEQRRHLYLSVKEALTNIARHAHAAEVLVRVVTSPGSLRVEISDDGVGLDSAAARQTSGSGRGLENLRGRARMLGGRLSIASGEARGTRIQLEIPLAGQRTSPA